MAAPEKKKTSMGMEENIASLLAYLLTIIGGLVFFFGEKENKNVRFHGLQSILLFCVAFAAQIVFWILGAIFALIVWQTVFIFGIIGWLIWFAYYGVAVFLAIKAYTGGKVKLPLIGDFAEKQVDK